MVHVGFQLRQAIGAGWSTSNRGIGLVLGVELLSDGSGSSYRDMSPNVLLDLPNARMHLPPSVEEKATLVKWQSSSVPALRSLTPPRSDQP